MARQRINMIFFQCGRLEFGLQLKQIHRKDIRLFSSSSSRRRNDELPNLDVGQHAPQELHDLLQKIRNTIFIPAFLKQRQRKLIYQAKNKNMLDTEPIETEIGSQKVTLQHIDRTKDVPDSWKSMRECLRLMQGLPESDWRRLLPELMRGWNRARRSFARNSVRVRRQIKIIRVAGECDRLASIIDTAKAVKSTGLQLRNLEIVRCAFWECRSKAFRSNWDVDETTQALKLAEQFAETVEEDDHAGGRKWEVGESMLDPRIQPDILGVMLELAAMRAYKSGEKVDEKTKVYAERVVHNLKHNPLIALAGDCKEEKSPGIRKKHNHELLRLVPVTNGLEIAVKLFDESIPDPDFIDQTLADLRKRIHKSRDELSRINQVQEQEGEIRSKGLEWCHGLDQVD